MVMWSRIFFFSIILFYYMYHIFWISIIFFSLPCSFFSVSIFPSSVELIFLSSISRPSIPSVIPPSISVTGHVPYQDQPQRWDVTQSSLVNLFKPSVVFCVATSDADTRRRLPPGTFFPSGTLPPLLQGHVSSGGITRNIPPVGNISVPSSGSCLLQRHHQKRSSRLAHLASPPQGQVTSRGTTRNMPYEKNTYGSSPGLNLLWRHHHRHSAGGRHLTYLPRAVLPSRYHQRHSSRWEHIALVLRAKASLGALPPQAGQLASLSKGKPSPGPQPRRLSGRKLSAFLPRANSALGAPLEALLSSGIPSNPTPSHVLMVSRQRWLMNTRDVEVLGEREESNSRG